MITASARNSLSSFLYNIKVSVWEGGIKYTSDIVTENPLFPIYGLCASAHSQVLLQTEQYQRGPFWERGASCKEKLCVWEMVPNLAPGFICALRLEILLFML